MKTYIVGGAVRDGLLGLPVKDRDHVVIGASPEEMRRLGFTPVGKDFPVFLHPVTHEEYALARTERKTAPGYKGFVFHAAPEVTLEEDLIRRDLTINAIAQAEDGTLIDPFGGRRDLDARIFRHVSPAFVEDPLRILRLARFAARFTDFNVAPDTNALMRRMVQAGEVDALVPERVWQEMARGLMEQKPSRMFEVLRECNALRRILPELDALWSDDQAGGLSAMRQIDVAAELQQTLPIRFAILACILVMEEVSGSEASSSKASINRPPAMSRNTEVIDLLCRRWKVPSECRDLAVMSAREIGLIQHALNLNETEIVALLERSDAFRKPGRFVDMLDVAQCRQHALESIAQAGKPFEPKARLVKALMAAQSVNAGEIAAEVVQHYPGQPMKIADAVRAARMKAVGVLLEWPDGQQQ